MVTIGAATHIGQEKKENQDSYAFNQPERGPDSAKGTFLVLADGMGGHSGGKHASIIAVSVAMAEYYRNRSDSIPVSLEKAFIKANTEVIKKSQTSEELKDMGSTLVAVVIISDKMYFANVGDSRGYIIDDNNISQFTEDHSFVASLVKAGAITEEEALTHPERNIITRAIGLKPELKVDLSEQPVILKEGQYIILCCDGLHGSVSNGEIIKIVKKYKKPGYICEKLVDKANENGGPDNITVMTAMIDNISLMSKLKNMFLNFTRSSK